MAVRINEAALKELPDVLTPAEVADVFRVDGKTVIRWAKAGKLPYFLTLGQHRRFYREDVIAALRAAARQGGAL